MLFGYGYIQTFCSPRKTTKLLRCQSFEPTIRLKKFDHTKFCQNGDAFETHPVWSKHCRLVHAPLLTEAWRFIPTNDGPWAFDVVRKIRESFSMFDSESGSDLLTINSIEDIFWSVISCHFNHFKLVKQSFLLDFPIKPAYFHQLLQLQ
jgi:hypothetical protein